MGPDPSASITMHDGLAVYRFGTGERFWLNLQARCDLEVAKDRLGSRLDQEVIATAR